jgi:hypothetical protein
VIRSREAIYSDHRAIDPSVTRELRALDPNLFVTWSELYLDLITGRPLERRDGKPIRYPRWHVWIYYAGDGVIHHLFDAEVLDHRIPQKIRADVARHLEEKEINERIEAEKARRKERANARWNELHRDVVTANRAKFDEIFEGDNLMRGPSENTRDARIMSYDGQPNRASAWDAVRMTTDEEGWELPDWRREMEGYA